MARFLMVRAEKHGQTVREMIEKLNKERAERVAQATVMEREIYLIDKEKELLEEAARIGLIKEG